MFCATGGNRKVDLSTGEAQNFIERNLSQGDMILFTGGEPTIRQDIVHISNVAHSTFGASVSMLTNARRFCDDKFMSRMVGSGLTEVAASLYSHDRPLHEYLTRRKGSFAETVAGIRNLEESGVRVQVRTLITRPTYVKMHETVDFIRSHFNDVGIGICAMDVVENGFRNRATMVARLSDAAPYVEKAIDAAESCGLGISVIDFPMCLLEPRYRSAVVPRRRMHVDVKYTSPKTAELVMDQSGTVGSHNKCGTCSLRDTCSGTWQSYVSVYGDEELRPQ